MKARYIAKPIFVKLDVEMRKYLEEASAMKNEKISDWVRDAIQMRITQETINNNVLQ